MNTKRPKLTTALSTPSLPTRPTLRFPSRYAIEQQWRRRRIGGLGFWGGRRTTEQPQYTTHISTLRDQGGRWDLAVVSFLFLWKGNLFYLFTLILENADDLVENLDSAAMLR